MLFGKRDNMKRRVLKNSLCALVITMILLLSHQVAFAEGMNYTVSPVLSESQVSETTSYFDLKMAKKQSENIQVKITNQSSSNQTFKVLVHTATTNQNGIIDYSGQEKNYADSMVYSLADLVTTDEPTVTVPGNSGKDVTLTVKMPDKPFEGILLGGITIEPVTEKAEKGQVNNIYTHTLAVQVSESDKVIKPELTFGEVSLDQINYHNVVNLTVQNQTPTILTNVTATMTIREKGKSDPIVTQTKKGLSIAPHSVFPLPVEWQDLFTPGEYEYEVNIKNSEHKWSATKSFTVKKEESEKLNDLSVDEKQANPLWLYISLGAILLILVLIIVIYIRKKKQK